MVRRCDAPQPLPLWMFVVDTVCIAAFTAGCCCASPRRRRSGCAASSARRRLVDVAAILPYFLELFHLDWRGPTGAGTLVAIGKSLVPLGMLMVFVLSM